jgi:hypothetical protein
MNVPDSEVRAVRYQVSCLPETHEDASMFTVVVEYRGDGLWAVTRSGAYYDADGNRSWGVVWEDGREPVTDDEMTSYAQAREGWLARYRFDEQSALDLAKRLAPAIAYRGYTVADALGDREAALSRLSPAPAVQDAAEVPDGS